MKNYAAGLCINCTNLLILRISHVKSIPGDVYKRQVIKDREVFLMKKKIITAVLTAALAAGTLFGSSVPAEAAGTDYYDEIVTLSLLVDQDWLNTYEPALQALSDAALEKFNIEIELENKTNGSDGDNIVKTRLAAGEMTDLLIFNSGAQFTACLLYTSPCAAYKG